MRYYCSATRGQTHPSSEESVLKLRSYFHMVRSVLGSRHSLTLRTCTLARFYLAACKYKVAYDVMISCVVILQCVAPPNQFCPPLGLQFPERPLGAQCVTVLRGPGGRVLLFTTFCLYIKAESGPPGGGRPMQLSRGSLLGGHVRFWKPAGGSEHGGPRGEHHEDLSQNLSGDTDCSKSLSCPAFGRFLGLA